jgi:hypothetical protein
MVWGSGRLRRSLQRVPLASSIQYGAKSPLKAVTKTTPPLSGTDSASEVISLDVPAKPRLFMRNFTPAPATAMLPSRAYTGFLPLPKS